MQLAIVTYVMQSPDFPSNLLTQMMNLGGIDGHLEVQQEKVVPQVKVLEFQAFALD
jgi:hypothetical protein